MTAGVRLFVGGVAAGTTAAEVAQRFEPFGAVSSVDLVPAKRLGGGRDPHLYTAFLNVAPHSTTDVQRCISLVCFACSSADRQPHCTQQYNGCVWRGERLRVERAAEHFASRLERERAAADAALQHAQETAAAAAAIAAAAQSVAREEALRRLLEAKLLLRGPGDAVRVSSVFQPALTRFVSS